MRLHPKSARFGGSVVVDGRDILAMPYADLARYRGKIVSMIFQDPGLALDPVYRVGDQIAEAVMRHEGVSRAEARARALGLFERVRIPSPERRLDNYPHEMSGGMRQRAMIALALACRPKVLLADEPTTALDATVQIQVLLLLRELQRELGLAVIFVTHDIGVAVEVADRIAVMYGGRIVEMGQCADVIRNPAHPYTHGLSGLAHRSRRREGLAAGDDPRLAAGLDEPAAGLLLQPALPARDRALSSGAAAAGLYRGRITSPPASGLSPRSRRHRGMSMRVLLLNANTNPAMTEHVVAGGARLCAGYRFHRRDRPLRLAAYRHARDLCHCRACRARLLCRADRKIRRRHFGLLRRSRPWRAAGSGRCAGIWAGGSGLPRGGASGGARFRLSPVASVGSSMLTDYLMPLGLTDYLASVRAVDVTGSQILADPEGSLDKLAQACRLAVTQDGATSVILGGAGLVGLAARMTNMVPVPLMDCLEPAIDAVRGAASKDLSSHPPAGGAATSFVGIGQALSDLLEAEIAKDNRGLRWAGKERQ